MNNENPDRQTAAPDIREVFIRAGQLYKTGFTAVITLGLFHAILAETGRLAFGYLKIPQPELLIIFQLFFTAPASAALIDLADKLYRKKNALPGVSVQRGFRLYLPYISVSLGAMAAIFLGLILFIIPGVYLATIFLFADLLVVLKKLPFQECFLRSARLVRPRFWFVLAFNMLIALVLLLPSMIIMPLREASPGVGSALNNIVLAFVVPFYALAQVVLFHLLVKTEPSTTTEETVYE